MRIFHSPGAFDFSLHSVVIDCCLWAGLLKIDLFSCWRTGVRIQASIFPSGGLTKQLPKLSCLELVFLLGYGPAFYDVCEVLDMEVALIGLDVSSMRRHSLG